MTTTDAIIDKIIDAFTANDISVVDVFVMKDNDRITADKTITDKATADKTTDKTTDKATTDKANEDISYLTPTHFIQKHAQLMKQFHVPEKYMSVEEYIEYRRQSVRDFQRALGHSEEIIEMYVKICHLKPDHDAFRELGYKFCAKFWQFGALIDQEKSVIRFENIEIQSENENSSHNKILHPFVYACFTKETSKKFLPFFLNYHRYNLDIDGHEGRQNGEYIGVFDEMKYGGIVETWYTMTMNLRTTNGLNATHVTKFIIKKESVKIRIMLPELWAPYNIIFKGESATKLTNFFKNVKISVRGLFDAGEIFAKLIEHAKLI